MEVVCALLEHGGHHLAALLIQQPDLDAPGAHGEALHLRRLIAVRAMSAAGVYDAWAGPARAAARSVRTWASGG
jgi:hypothetical protein